MNTNTIDRPAPRSLSSRLATQSSRRALVLAWALCCAAFLLLGGFQVLGVIWFVVIALALVCDGLLYAATHRVTDRPTSSLDEREQGLRNRAYRSAYLILFGLVVIVVGGSFLLFTTGNEVASAWFSHPANHPAVLSGFTLATLQLASLLPTAIVAWTEPDEPGEAD